LTVYSLNPLHDSRWAEFVQTQKKASIFHTAEWLKALKLTYGYEPIAFTTSAPGTRLTNGVVFCRIASWLTGHRIVSLPFADHCEPLLEDGEDRNEIFDILRASVEARHWKYVEIRARSAGLLGGVNSQEKGRAFYFHVLDLTPPLEALFSHFQKSCIQRMIRRAEREGLLCEEGRSEGLLRQFYELMLKTRRRHKLPPQPISWFRNLTTCLGERLSIRVASKDGSPMASILTLSYGNTLVYKYGCSDARYHHDGPMPFLFWDAIRRAKEDGLTEFDLGRSDLDNPGLITFKNRWGAKASMLEYVRFSSVPSEQTNPERGMQVAQRLFSYMPDGLLTAAGRLLYRHIG
jgi:hypothetical protein